MKKKIRYYIAAVRWLWENHTWANTRQKWKAFDRDMKKLEVADREKT